MVRYMADSIECSQFPAAVSVPGVGVQPVSLRAGYVGGTHEASSHACGPVDVDIDVDGTHPSADVLDIEPGDATPDTAPSWVQRHNAVSSFPAVLYCNRTTIHAVANALAAAGLQVVKDYRWWIATLDGTTSVADMTGVVAVQAWGSSYFPTNIDLSVVYDDSWKASSVTAPTNPSINDQIADSVWWTSPNSQVKRDNPQGVVYSNPALQEIGDIKTFFLNGTTPAGESAQGLITAIAKAVVAELGSYRVDITVNGAQVPPSGP